MEELPDKFDDLLNNCMMVETIFMFMWIPDKIISIEK